MEISELEMPTDQEEVQGTPLDMVLSRIDSYIQDPKLVTPETLGELRDELLAIKEDVEGETPEQPVEGMAGAIREKMA